jgi:ribosomal protein S27AE
MPRLACWSCGRQIYTTVPLESLFAEERRCPRCGAFLDAERREQERRVMNRRQNPPDDPGPPIDAGEQRIADRRVRRRRAG